MSSANLGELDRSRSSPSVDSSAIDSVAPSSSSAQNALDLVSPSRMGDVNRARVLGVLSGQGPVTRAQLARMAGVPRSTIGGIVQHLLEDGLLEEQEAVSTNRAGKPGRPVWFSRDGARCGAVVVGGGWYQMGVVNARGEIVRRATGTFDATGTPAIAVRRIRKTATTMTAGWRGTLLGVGVTIPGACDATQRVVVACPRVPALLGSALTDALDDAFGCRALINEDARSLARGEKWYGGGRGLSSFAAIETGVGLGAGLVLDGAIYRGPRSNTAEIGHMCVNPTGDCCDCGLRGCWETIGTLKWLRLEAERSGIPGADKLDAARLSALVEQGDPASRDLLSRYAENIGVGLANLVQLLDIPVFLLHGDALGGGEPFRALIEEHVRGRVRASRRNDISVRLSSLGTDGPMLGAAAIVMSEIFQFTT